MIVQSTKQKNGGNKNDKHDQRAERKRNDPGKKDDG